MTTIADLRLSFEYEGQVIETGYDASGAGPTLVLLPSFSTVSTRAELRPLGEALGEAFRIVVPDWPGFGAAPSPRLNQGPGLHLAFLRAFCAAVAPQPAMVVAAGHAAGYALAIGPGAWTRIGLVAPTWRGPLPTMMGGYRPSQAWVRRAIALPVIGPALYRLNVADPVIAMMYRRHVFADPARVTRSFVAEKAAVARRPGARFGSAAFVTGALDPMHDRSEFLTAARAANAPIFVIYGENTPPKSQAEITALAQMPGVLSKRLPTGSLGLAEEQPDVIAGLLRPFLIGVPRHLGTK